MNNAELKELLINPRPVMFGSIMFNGIEAIIWRRMRRSVLLERDIGIVQVSAMDHTGSTYIINPKHLKFASPAAVNATGAAKKYLKAAEERPKKRRIILDIFREWCEEHDVAATLEHFLVFLDAEDLINANKAYNIALSREAEQC